MHRNETFEIRSERGRQRMEETFTRAVAQSNIKIVETCLEKGVDPNVFIDDRSALHIATIKGDMQLGVLLLCDPRIDLNLRTSVGTTPLMCACIYGRRKFVQALLAAGAKVNLISTKGKTALHYAAKTGNMGIIYDLVCHGATVSVRDVFDNTPLSIATIDYPSETIARFLLRKGACAIKIKDFPLFLECALTCHTQKRLKILQVLVAYNIDVNWSHPVSGMNCLHYLAITNYVPAAEFLLSSGANIQHCDKVDRTPLEVAIIHENIEMVRLFRDWIRNRRVYFSVGDDILEDIRFLYRR